MCNIGFNFAGNKKGGWKNAALARCTAKSDAGVAVQVETPCEILTAVWCLFTVRQTQDGLTWIAGREM
jgi:hypothetical protein